MINLKQKTIDFQNSISVECFVDCTPTYILTYITAELYNTL